MTDHNSGSALRLQHCMYHYDDKYDSIHKPIYLFQVEMDVVGKIAAISPFFCKYGPSLVRALFHYILPFEGLDPPFNLLI